VFALLGLASSCGIADEDGKVEPPRAEPRLGPTVSFLERAMVDEIDARLAAWGR
jgi:hypothetical protein